MVGVGDFTSLICGCAHKIQDLGNNWHNAAAAWEQFPQQVRQLEETLKSWEAECRNKDLSDDTLMQRVREAESLLKKEQRRLKKRDTRCGSGCWSRVCSTLFPARTRGIQDAMNAFDNIPRLLGSMEERRVHTDKLVQAKSFSDRITPDDRYVHLKVSEAEIYKALDSLDGPMVVLLHGGPGKGKSSLARNTVVHYNKESHLGPGPRFEHVFFLSCGPKASAEDTLLELIQRLGSGPISTPEDGQQNGSIRIQKHIRALLAVPKVLIILDDVSHGEFLVEIVKVCGSGVKCLVTSQLANLCQGTLQSSEFLKIQIQDIELEDARKILASHVGLPGQEIPENVQEVANKMILQTDCNPLALASLAATIDLERSADLKEWQEASKYLFEVLDREIKAGLFHGKYPGTFWTSTKQSIDNLKEDSRKLLLLLHACQGESVPEVVVEMLYKGLRLQKVSGPFSLVRSELRDRQLIKINETIDSVSSSNLGIQRSWSIHSLHKLYIQEEMREARGSIFISLAMKDNEVAKVESQIINEFEEEEKTTTTSLCALYLDKEFASMAATNMDVPLERFNIKRRNVIEPITLLLGLPLSPTWTQFEQVSARKVFLNYITNGILDNSNISHLFQLEITTPLMCKVLQDISFLEDTCMVGENIKGLLTILVTWLVEGVDHGWRKQSIALIVLRSFAYNGSHVMFLISFPNVLEGITTLLQGAPSQNNSNHYLQILAARVLINLLAGRGDQDNAVKLKFINHPSVLHELVNSLTKEANEELQKYAAVALGNLAGGGDEIRVKIVVKSPRVISVLVNSLFRETNLELQEKATEALGKLALGPDEIIVKIVNHPKALSKLVHSLSQEANPRLQEFAAYALGNLANIEDENIRFHIKATNGIIEALLCLLVSGKEHQLQGTQEYAIMTITLLDPSQGNALHLYFVLHYEARIYANVRVGLWKEALVDCDQALKLEQVHSNTILRNRCFVRAMMGDYQGALEDADIVVNSGDDPELSLQERGVVKRMIGNLHGALEDLNKALTLCPDDYEMLKHRGYVKFLMEDEEGAHKDAEWALRVKPSCVENPRYGKTNLTLGCTSVQYLGYKLK